MKNKIILFCILLIFFITSYFIISYTNVIVVKTLAKIGIVISIYTLILIGLKIKFIKYMIYTEEDYNFIKNWLNKCVKIEQDDFIYYVASNNILRQLKYNRLYNENKKIKVDLTKINFIDNIILEQDLKNKYLNINYYKIWLFFYSKYKFNYQENKELINDILRDILNLKQYTIFDNNIIRTNVSNDILNLKFKITYN